MNFCRDSDNSKCRVSFHTSRVRQRESRISPFRARFAHELVRDQTLTAPVFNLLFMGMLDFSQKHQNRTKLSFDFSVLSPIWFDTLVPLWTTHTALFSLFATKELSALFGYFDGPPSEPLCFTKMKFRTLIGFGLIVRSFELCTTCSLRCSVRTHLVTIGRNRPLSKIATTS